MISLRQGLMGSGKSAALIDLAERSYSANVFTCGDRSGTGRITSRNGKWIHAAPIDDMPAIFPEYSVVLIDEAQWLSPSHIHSLIRNNRVLDYLTVVLFGLSVDYLGQPFPNQGLLDELTFKLPMPVVLCSCGSEATQHALITLDGIATQPGLDVIADLFDPTHPDFPCYQTVCSDCWSRMTSQ